MRSFRVFVRAALTAAVIASALTGLSGGTAFSQNADKPAEAQKAQEAAAKESQKKIDEIAEASRVMTGAAANAECVWVGRRAVSLMWRDDLDTAFRHIELYDRFGCPGGHVQAAFRCVVKQGPIDPKAQDTLNSRVHACWLNPAEPPAATAAQAPAAEGTTTR
jgi:hypothetical protein